MESLEDSRVQSSWPFLAVFRVFGVVVTLFAFVMLVPVGFGLFEDHPAALLAFQESILVTLVIGMTISGLTWWHRR